ncbi:aminoglycoside phosphotransferase family protein [Lentzea sp. BCCO 10_0856]|uniref:Aminoglycoside phosphotransferase family protein n=1 Tax=Lentzea miocenica TaxID=3095431 RepID=A0ABU4SWF5_9PSEU|nr:aminoglycoside phosphotransferase family protein [Lentzea sp. BCCO 10_0856]MDX8030225.1 aminoglycoside phosphotransferase family protein [Lentzea sp. BCCO 10_0856]
MHDGEIATDVSLVDELVRTQFPRWHGLPITQLEHGGTDHAIYRLGDELAVRLPRIEWSSGQAERDAATLPKLAPHLPVAVPEPLELGEPTENYPYRWSVVRWLSGDIATIGEVSETTGIRLAELVQALHGIDTAVEAWTTYRGRLDHASSDDRVRESIAELGNDPRLLALWREVLDAPHWDQPARWLHADLHEGNLLFTDRELTGVIDWGCAAVGDPAGDLMTAWLFLDERGRRAFRRELAEFDDATWLRAQGWALELAVVALPYYRDTNPFLVGVATRTIEQLLAERAG